MAISISHLSFEHHRHALGIAETEPRISWRLEGSAFDWEQTSYDLEVSRLSGDTEVFTVNSSDSVLVPWPSTPLASVEQAAVRARAHGKISQDSTPWSDWVTVETGLLDESRWQKAVPISADWEVNIDAPKRPVYFRKTFNIEAPIQSARLYITSYGIYESEINGKKVGDSVLAPGWQSYWHRLAYDTFDVTDLLQEHDNAIGITVAEGWYVGRIGSRGGERNFYGDKVASLALLRVTLENGTTVEIPTDSSWQAGYGPIRNAEIYDGETYDSRLEAQIAGWSTSSFNASGWGGSRALAPPTAKLVSPDGPPVRRTGELKPVEIFTSLSNKTIIDFGQNLVGWVRLRAEGAAGNNITIRHAEVMEDGELGTRPLRLAAATDHFILHGQGIQSYEPRFTFHGFRYAEVEGLSFVLHEDNITAVVVHSDMEQTGWFECSNPLLNKLHDNVRWSMKGNFLSIPTDCPQRDERLGWTGDAHAFGPTSNFLYNTAGLWKSWHKDVWYEMSKDGSMHPPAYVPRLIRHNDKNTTAIWGDVVVGNPYNIFSWYGDQALLESHFQQAQAWIDIGIPRDESGLWDRSGFQWGDWLDPTTPPDDPSAGQTTPYLVADAYLVQMTKRIAEIAKYLGKQDLSAQYFKQHADLTREYQTAWMDNGMMANRSQTAYVLALMFDLYTDENERAAAGQTLREIVQTNDYLVGTGFAATHFIGFALDRANGTDDFYKMLLQTQTPSWLYQVVQNGTTTWERWDSMLPNGTINPGQMTSFNHYAYGSVADWMHQRIGGLSPREPGFKVSRIAPQPGGGLTNASVRFLSAFGEISSHWWFENNEEENALHRNGFHLVVQIPPNTRAEVVMPGTNEVTWIGSGRYEFHDPSHTSY